VSEEQKPTRYQWLKGNTPIVVAILLTCVVVFIAAALGHQKVSISANGAAETVETVSRWEWFFHLPPNAMGDTLAGLLGALTLIWIIASVFHQSKELADQREIMREQKKEYELMVQAQNAQVDAMKAQSDLLIFQRTILEQNRARDNLERSLSMLVASLRDLGGLRHWERMVEGNETNAQTGVTQIKQRWEVFAPGIGGGVDIDEMLRSSLETLRWFKLNLETPGRIRARDGQKSAARSEFVKILPAIVECQRHSADLSDVEKLRVERLDLEKLSELVEWFLSRDLWDQSGSGKERFTQ
jgi:hypothetical protein